MCIRDRDNIFYKIARLYSTDEILEMLKSSGFKTVKIGQTIFTDPEIIKEPEEWKEGYGQGGFVAILSEKIASPDICF